MTSWQLKQQSLDHMLTYASDYDSLYREGLDGFIGIKLVSTIGKNPIGQTLQMMTILDISTVQDNKR